MTKAILLVLLTGAAALTHAQSLKKYNVGTSGCAVYTYCDLSNAEMNLSPDSSEVYTAECRNEDVHYGAICVKLSQPASDLDVAENLLIQYLDFLKPTFEVNNSVGYGKGHRLKGNDQTRGIIDYWTDKDTNNIKVKGWTNGNFIVVLYAYSQKDLPETKVNVYLDSLVFP